MIAVVNLKIQLVNRSQYGITNSISRTHSLEAVFYFLLLLALTLLECLMVAMELPKPLPEESSVYQ